MCLSDSQDAGSLRKKNKKKKRGKAQNTRTSSGDSDVPLNMTNSTTDAVQPDLTASRVASKTASSAQVCFFSLAEKFTTCTSDIVVAVLLFLLFSIGVFKLN